MFNAQEEAQKLGEGYVSTEHLLLGILRDDGNVAAEVLRQLGIDIEKARHETLRVIGGGNAPNRSRDMTLTPRAKRVIYLSYDEARNLNNNYIGTEHLLLGLIREADGIAGSVLSKLGADLDRSRRVVMAVQGSRSAGEPLPPAAEPTRPRPKNVESVLLLIRQNASLPALMFLMAVADERLAGRQVLNRLGMDVSALQYDVEAQILNRSLPPSSVTIDELLGAAHQCALERGGPVNSGDLLVAVIQLDAPSAVLKDIDIKRMKEELRRME